MWNSGESMRGEGATKIAIPFALSPTLLLTLSPCHLVTLSTCLPGPPTGTLVLLCGARVCGMRRGMERCCHGLGRALGADPDGRRVLLDAGTAAPGREPGAAGALRGNTRSNAGWVAASVLKRVAQSGSVKMGI